MSEYKIDVTGHDSLLELIQVAQHSNRILNREPNTVILSEEMGAQLLLETGAFFKKEHSDEIIIPKIEDLIGGSVFGMDIIVVKNKGYDYIEVLEVLK